MALSVKDERRGRGYRLIFFNSMVMAPKEILLLILTGIRRASWLNQIHIFPLCSMMLPVRSPGSIRKQ
jgi:hypothetical protein